MSLSVETIIDVAKVSQYLADNAIAMNQESDKQLANKLYIERKTIEWAYDFIPNDDYLTKNANYLFAMCGSYGVKALGIIGQGGGVVPTPSGDAVLIPFDYYHVVTSGEANQTSLTDTELMNVSGVVTLFINQQPFQLNIGFTFSSNSTSGTIDFDLTPGNVYTLQENDVITFNAAQSVTT